LAALPPAAHERLFPQLRLVAGSAYRLTRARLKQEFERHGEMLHILLRYAQALITQMAQTAVCNRRKFVSAVGHIGSRTCASAPTAMAAEAQAAGATRIAIDMITRYDRGNTYAF
jgi:hypothetical protein